MDIELWNQKRVEIFDPSHVRFGKRTTSALIHGANFFFQKKRRALLKTSALY